MGPVLETAFATPNKPEASVKRAPTPKEIEAALNKATLTAQAARLPIKPSTMALPPAQLSERLTTLRDQLVQSDMYVDWKQLEEMRILGGGAYATVTKCYYQPREGRRMIVAVKQIKTELLTHPHDIRAFVKEARLLHKLRHKYITEFYGCGWWKATEESESVHGSRIDSPLPSQQQLFYLQECLEGGTLQQMVFRAMTSQGTKVYTDGDALRWALQIAQALEYMHTRSPAIMHRDLKLENVLLSDRRPRLAVAKLADFGLARRLHGTRQGARAKRERIERSASLRPEELDAPTRQRSAALEGRLSEWMAIPNLAERSYHGLEMTAPAGSMGYMAPEVLRGEPYNEKADVFSFGIVLYNLFHRNIPTLHIFLNGSFEDLEAYAHRVAHGFRQPIAQAVPLAVAELIQACWQGRPELRPSMTRVVAELELLQVPEEPNAETAGCGCSIM